VINPVNDPVACYLAIQGKIEQNPDEDYPLAEMSQDLAYILLACRTLIQKNSQLALRLLEAEQSKDDAIVKAFQKDIEIHELTQNLKKNQQKEEN
jgi:hypothetical protein